MHYFSLQKIAYLFGLLCLCLTVQAQSFTYKAIKSYPFPTELTAAAKANNIAWALDEQGKRNVYVAEAPAYTPRQLSQYTNDDGQEITSLSLSANGKWVVYVRGGDHGSNWGDAELVNPGFSAKPEKIQVWTIPFAGGTAKSLGEGDNPVISPRGDSVVFTRGGQAYVAAVDGSAAATSLFTTRGTVSALSFSPNGNQLVFVANRSDHSLIGVYDRTTGTLRWIAPSFSKDLSPQWSPDGKQLAFIRTAGSGGAPDSLLARKPQPWSIYTADVASGTTTLLYTTSPTLKASASFGYNLHWAAQNRIVFMSYADGWQHLYSLPATGGQPLLLTPGNFMAEHISMSTNGQYMYFSANTGANKLDIDRRHVVRVPVNKPEMEVLTPGAGLEWTPAPLANGDAIALISATATRPPVPAVLQLSDKQVLLIGAANIPATFPQQLVTPKQVTFKAADGTTLHAQLFEPTGGAGKKPAIVYVHGGPQRQMLLGWHYSDYYSNAYATNQYLASLGFVVLSINYRLGIGYGYAFHQPEKGGRFGASEYQDIRAAGMWLAAQSFVDRQRIGIYGGSYGGYLTALALARDPKMFAAGVDIHGVHDWTTSSRNQPVPSGYEKIPDFDAALKIAYLSSPVASLNKWSSPVLIIHADDDRNVQFNQSTDLVRRLEKLKVPMETMVIVDDTHHWMKHENAVKVGEAVADFFVRKLKP